MLKNSSIEYGLIAKLLHWLSAVIIIGLFVSGFIMVELNYYSPWYRVLPYYHKSIGIILAAIIILRLIWRWSNVQPHPDTHLTKIEIYASHLAHISIYSLIIIVTTSGYLIPTAKNQDINVFNWFTLPSLGSLFENQEDISGLIHQYAAYALIGLAIIHALAALKHHFFDKDNTLKKMLPFYKLKSF